MSIPSAEHEILFVRNLSTLIQQSYDRTFDELSRKPVPTDRSDLMITVLTTPKAYMRYFQKQTPMNHHSMKAALDWFSAEWIPEPVRQHGYYRTRLLNILLLLQVIYDDAVAKFRNHPVELLAVIGEGCDDLQRRFGQIHLRTIT